MVYLKLDRLLYNASPHNMSLTLQYNFCLQLRNIFFVLLCLCLFATQVLAQGNSQITQFGITWTFDKPYQVGQFVNGDYWVIGPVTITSITPVSSTVSGRTINGSMVNPKGGIQVQGYDSAMYANYGSPATTYNSSLNFAQGISPETPKTLAPGSSLVSTISVEKAGARPQLTTAAVLTVLSEIPPTGAFRPAYSGSNKTIKYLLSQVKREILPSLKRTSGAPTPVSKAWGFERPWLDHVSEWTGRYCHPVQNLPDYGSDIGIRSLEGALALYLDYPQQEKELLMIRYIQLGIDLYGIWQNGGSWRPNGGHSLGRKLPISLAAVLLDDPEMKARILNSKPTDFDENGGTYHSVKHNRVLFGQAITCGGEYEYWRSVAFDKGSRTCPDPYQQIDGGRTPGGSYQYCCLSMPWKGTALAVMLVPEVRQIWKNESFFSYVDRWVASGAWSQTDTCAPLPGGTTETNFLARYGVDFGPDGKGACITDKNPADGIGRFPTLHGISKDSGGYGSSFANAMWVAYRASVVSTGALFSLTSRSNNS